VRRSSITPSSITLGCSVEVLANELGNEPLRALERGELELPLLSLGRRVSRKLGAA
jgi:hypothetical protein